jgi:hypothetical protein
MVESIHMSSITIKSPMKHELAMNALNLAALATTFWLGFGLGNFVDRWQKPARVKPTAPSADPPQPMADPSQPTQPLDPALENAKRAIARYQKELEIQQAFGSSPSKSARNVCPWQSWSNDYLREITLSIVNEARQYIVQKNPGYTSLTETKKQAIVFDYQAHYLAITIGLQEALLSRLFPSIDHATAGYYPHIADLHDIDRVADNLEALARQLI